MAVVLIVEDDLDTCESLRRFLQKHHHVPTCAIDGQQAMAALIEQKPDVVLLDLNIPEMDGMAFLNVMRSYLQWTTLPVIIVTGIQEPRIEEEAQKLGVKRVFHKTRLDFGELLAAVNNEITPR